MPVQTDWHRRTEKVEPSRIDHKEDIGTWLRKEVKMKSDKFEQNHRVGVTRIEHWISSHGGERKVHLNHISALWG